VAVCPSSLNESGAGCGFIHPNYRPYGTSYGYNCYTIGCSACRIKSTGHLRRPAELMMVADGAGGPLRPYAGPDGNAVIGQEGSGGCATAYIEPHSGGVNVAYFDGHVKWMKSAKFWAPTKSAMQTYLPWSNAERAGCPTARYGS